MENKNFEKNIKIIEVFNKEYAKAILACKKEDWITHTRSKNRDFNFIIKSDANILYPAYDMENARKQIRENVKGSKFENNDASVIIGIGCGHLLKAILSKKEKKHIVVVVEPCFELLNTALNNYDFSEWLKESGLVLVSDLIGARQAIQFIDANTIIEKWLLTVEAYTTIKISIYKDFVEEVQNTINQIQCGTGTIMAAGKEIALNDIKNVPNVIGFPGGSSLFDKFKGKPAILVNTGPSLTKNIHILKKIYEEKSALILAVGQALRVLLSYDIVPDLITTVDYGKVNITHFNGLMESQVPLVALNRTHAELLDKWQGPKFIISTPYHEAYEGTSASILKDKGYLDQGGSVSHFLFSLANKMGCNPIVLTGQDLALTDGKSHIVNADSQGDVRIDSDGIIQWKVEDKRSPELDGKEHQMGFATYVDGYFGEKVLTNIGLKSFITSFVHMIKAMPEVEVIDATQGGARIEGAKQMSLKKVKQLYCKNDLSKIKRSIVKIYNSEFKKEASNLKKKVKSAISIFEKESFDMKMLKEAAELGLKWNEKIKHADETGNTFAVKKALKQNEKYSNEAKELASKNSLLVSSIYSESRQIGGKELAVEGRLRYKIDSKDELKIRLKRNKIILEATSREAESLNKTYEKTIEKLRNLHKNKYKSLERDDKIPNLKDAADFLKKGSWAVPYIESCRIINDPSYNSDVYVEALKIHRQCVKLKNRSLAESKKIPDETKLIEYNELVYVATVIGRDKKDFKTAQTLLNKAIKLMPKFPTAVWGKATILCFSKKYEESLAEYNKLIELVPDNTRMKFERALVLLNIDIDKAIKDLSKVIKVDPQYNYFLKNLARILSKKGEGRKSIIAYEKYLEKYDYDEEAHKELRVLLSIYGKKRL